MKFLRFLNNIQDKGKPSESWQKAIIIPVHKEGNIKHGKSMEE
jgi:hypothetical protein